ncbi:uncharacterized protein MONOS_2091 [Monocercomonoides exilis]|uniref:uncharacterized protein n=1 Tax=Monocercomonoides exilis TaxID=2049356 RepID=UPI0035595AC7|nr:hypothetical protein MONOS_2091 [Monocercomonoides exilis]|eukprot:MONOS_2091.1-p1 / transcript=MONOS_2091.1 / gene=MONOS_2091 / organism=Monocercomonoides_exilis_PA203 / gene_product=unspecified product / transcript_product=unspecified product / location=Mono_scaffold00041:31258-32097(+) / protein_length=279 / sequence_SO=supercontig / SO=protein_coding / is_pseudo=false
MAACSTFTTSFAIIPFPKSSFESYENEFPSLYTEDTKLLDCQKESFEKDLKIQMIADYSFDDVVQVHFDGNIMNNEFIEVMSDFIGKSVAFTNCHAWHNSKRHIRRNPIYSSLLTPIRAIGTKFIEDLSDQEALSFSNWTNLSREEISLVNYLRDIACGLMKTMSCQMRIRQSEFLQGLILLERVLTGQLTDIPFVLTRDNMPMALCVCVMLANKLNADVPFSNAWWSHAFGIPIPHLAKSELFFLSCLSYTTSIKKEEFQAAVDTYQKLLASYQTRAY